jgi:hypothetical protein
LKVYRDKKVATKACEQLNIDIDDYDAWVANDEIFKKELEKTERLIEGDLEWIMYARGGVFGRNEYIKFKFGSAIDLFNALKYRNPRKYDKASKSKAFSRQSGEEAPVVVNIPGEENAV